MRFGYVSRRIAVHTVLGLAAMMLTGCATEPRVCYQTVEHPEFGRLLQRAPCSMAEEP